MIAGAFIVAMLAAGDGAVSCPPATLAAGTAITLVTTAPLSSKISVKGDLVTLRTAEDVRLDDQIVIPKGTEATGQISDARATGGLGMGGRLAVRPLYLKVGNTVVRLSGTAQKNGGAPAGTVIGVAILTPVISGRSALIPAETPIAAVVEKAVQIRLPGPPGTDTDKGC
jgi:hypothetical protein